MNKWIMAGTAAAFTGAAAFARSEYERTHLDIVHYDIKTDKLGLEWNGFKAVFLSDLHDNSFGMENMMVSTIEMRSGLSIASLNFFFKSTSRETPF